MHWLIAHEAIVIGVTFMLVLGPAVGNYACSVVYRLPRGQTPFERHPFCGYCDADLKPIDLFPILSWCLTRGCCRYCGSIIPPIYTVIEIVCGLIFVLYFLHFGITENFLLYTAYGVFVVILAAIQWQQDWIAQSVYAYALTAIALIRTLHDGTIYRWFDGGMLMLVFAVAAHWLNAKLRGTRFDPFTTPWIWWLVLMATLLPIQQWLLLIVPLFFLLLFFSGPREYRVLSLIPITACALWMPMVAHA